MTSIEEPMETEDAGQQTQAAGGMQHPDQNAAAFGTAGSSMDPPTIVSQPQPLSANTEHLYRSGAQLKVTSKPMSHRNEQTQLGLEHNEKEADKMTGGGSMNVEDTGWNPGSDSRPTPLTALNSDAQTGRPLQSPAATQGAFNVTGGGSMDVEVPGWNPGSDKGPTSLTALNSDAQTGMPPQSPATTQGAFNVTGGGRMDVEVPGLNPGSDKGPTSLTALNSDAQTGRPPQSPAATQGVFNLGEGTSNENTGRAQCLVLDWPKDQELRKHHLEKALQTWFNKNEKMSNTSCSIESLSDNRCAEVIITPASALEHLLMSQEISLPVKGKKTATIKFQPTTDSQSQPAVHSPLPSAAQEVKTHMEPQSAAADPRGQETELSIPFPLNHFVYLNQAYWDEMTRIQQENGVTIRAEAKVSFEVDQKNNGNSPNPQRACAEFTKLAQKHLGDFDSVNVPLELADQGEWKRMLHNIQREESKLVLSASCREMTVIGPCKSVADVRESLQITLSALKNASFSAAASQQPRHKTTKEIGMVFKDPSVSGGLPMDTSHWKVMATTFKKTLEDIQTKYSVSLEPKQLSLDKVMVRVKPAGSSAVANSLESHAFRALLRLYQKVVTSTMSCSLQLPNQAKAVADKLQDMYPGVGLQDHHGSWTLFGLPQNLGPALNALERELGKPMFKDHDKNKIGFSSYNNKPSAGAATASGATAAGETKEDCPICLDNCPQMEKLKCGHELCKDCMKRLLETTGPICPLCKDVFGKMEGDQPHGSMTWHSANFPLPGFPHCRTITIDYNIPGGKQTEKHPNPGRYYSGTQRRAYLPDNKEGKEVVMLLRKAFDQKLIFTIGTSRTTGSDDQVTWNDIHHKTNMSGGPEGFGYPDDNYLSRVKAELKAKGVE